MKPLLRLVLLVSFLAVPLLEIYVILQIGGLIGPLATVALLLADSAFGAWIVRREGLRAWRSLQETVAAGSLPDRQLADAALVLIGGTLLLTPGFVTDGVGLFLTVPLTRPLARRVAALLARRRLETGATTGPTGHANQTGNGTRTPGSTRIVRGQVVDDERDRY